MKITEKYTVTLIQTLPSGETSKVVSNPDDLAASIEDGFGFPDGLEVKAELISTEIEK